MSPDPVLLDELVRRTVEAVQPRRIILFGSAARGTMGPQSDLDVLVVMPYLSFVIYHLSFVRGQVQQAKDQ